MARDLNWMLFTTEEQLGESHVNCPCQYIFLFKKIIIFIKTNILINIIYITILFIFIYYSDMNAYIMVLFDVLPLS